MSTCAPTAYTDDSPVVRAGTAAFSCLMCVVPSLLLLLYWSNRIKCPAVIKYTLISVLLACLSMCLVYMHEKSQGRA